MSDTAPDTGTEPTPDAKPTEGDTPEPADLTAEVEKWKAQARKHEERAKANAAAAKELEEFRKATMTDLEKAVAEARDEGKAEGLALGAGKVAIAEFKAAAAGRLADEQLASLLENLDIKGFLDEDGEVVTERVAAFVDSIAPKPADPGFVDLGQGSRGGNGTTGADPLLESVRQFIR